MDGSVKANESDRDRSADHGIHRETQAQANVVNDPRVMAHEGESARARHGIAGSQCHNGKAKRKENRWNPEKK
jgi:hypothetical protein